MELKKFVAPFDALEALDCIEKIFGVEERLLEECQLSGSEAAYNTDIVYLAYEKETLLGMIHATIPCHAPYLAGLSAMFTTEAARGKGIGSLLFERMVDEISARGVRLSVLGTSNPVAAKLYTNYGFGFCPGSHVMARFSEGHMVDFVRDYYRTMVGKAEVIRGNPSMRIPIVPLVLQNEFGLILDMNANIFNTSIVTERSCMGLFPRYEAIRIGGGEYYMAFDEVGTLGAVCSVSPQENSFFRGDFFALPSFKSVIPDMIRTIEEDFTNVYFEIAESDKGKAEYLKENGLIATGEGCCKMGEMAVNTVKYRRESSK